MTDDDSPNPFGDLPPEQLLTVLVRRLRHVEEALKAVRGLVPTAFEEGFRRANPDPEEPWLADWLMSDSKQALEAIFPRRPPPES